MSSSYRKIEQVFKHQTLKISLWSSVGVHVLYLLFYLILFDRKYNPAVYTIGSSLLFHPFYFYWISKEKYNLVTYTFIIGTELLLVFLAFYIFGSKTGIHYLLLIFSMLSFSINNEKKIKFSHVLFIVNIVLFLGGELEFIPHHQMVTFPVYLLPYVKASCILITLGLIYYLSVYFKKTRIKKEIQIENNQKEIQIQAKELNELNIKLKANIEYIEIQNKELEIANTTKNKLFSIISHDLINPLSTLSTFTDLLNNNIGSNTIQEQNKLIQGISESVISLNQLTQNLLNWSRTQFDTIKTSKTNFLINQVIKSNIRLYQQNLETKNIEVKNDVLDEVVVYADKDMIDIVIRNILNNAIKFSFAGSQIDIFSIEKGNEIEISIRDYGVGMNENTRANLFQIKNTKSTYGTNNEKGSGLGLIICNEFLKLNNCKFNVVSEVGKGTTFIITLPKG